MSKRMKVALAIGCVKVVFIGVSSHLIVMCGK